jgi:hypothetical protein
MGVPVESLLSSIGFDWIGWVDAIGYAGGAVTLWGFHQRTMIPLRLGAIGGNIGFLLFGILAASYPTLVLHAVLLPLNVTRLVQSQRLIREIQTASEGEGDLHALIPFMSERRFRAGHVLFRKGDEPDSMIVIADGTVRLDEIGVDCGPGDVLGEMAAFTPDNARTVTAVCASDVRLHVLANETMLQLFYQNPRFGLYLVRLIVHRLHGNWADAEERAKAL